MKKAPGDFAYSGLFYQSMRPTRWFIIINVSRNLLGTNGIKVNRLRGAIKLRLEFTIRFGAIRKITKADF